MSLSDSDIAFAVDLFSDIAALTTRKMFGGMCVYSNNKVFALMSSDGQIYLKTTTPEALYGVPADQFHNMPYWSLPQDALDDPALASDLARKALETL